MIDNLFFYKKYIKILKIFYYVITWNKCTNLKYLIELKKTLYKKY